MASRTFSFDFSGSSAKPGSSRTQRCRSVKRTESGATPGCVSARAMAMSRTSVHLIGDSCSDGDCAPGRRARFARRAYVWRTGPSGGDPVPGDPHDHVLVRDAGLAAEPRARLEPGGLVQLVVLAILDLGERVEPRLDPDVAGGAGRDAAAVVGELDPGLLGGLQDRRAAADLRALSLGQEGDLR